MIDLKFPLKLRRFYLGNLKKKNQLNGQILYINSLLMFKTIKTILFKIFSIKQYLLLMHYSFFILYYLQILRFFPEYSRHYSVRKLIKKGDVVIDI